MVKKKGTPLTMEMFQEEIIPRFEEVVDEKFRDYRDEVLEFKQEVMGEIRTLRETEIVASHQYHRLDKRVTRAEKKLKLPRLDL